MDLTLAQTFKSTPITLIATILVIVGALNWLAVGALSTDYVRLFAGVQAKYVYIAVGIAGLYLAFNKVMWVTGNKQLIY